jgi:hypothetical protein
MSDIKRPQFTHYSVTALPPSPASIDDAMVDRAIREWCKDSPAAYDGGPYSQYLRIKMAATLRAALTVEP